MSPACSGWGSEGAEHADSQPIDAAPAAEKEPEGRNSRSFFLLNESENNDAYEEQSRECGEAGRE